MRVTWESLTASSNPLVVSFVGRFAPHGIPSIRYAPAGLRDDTWFSLGKPEGLAKWQNALKKCESAQIGVLRR
jgi:hypothetical protein